MAHAGLLTPGNLDSTMHVCVLARAEHSYSMWMERYREERFLFVFSIFADRPHVRSNLYFFRVFGCGKGEEKKIFYYTSFRQSKNRRS